MSATPAWPPASTPRLFVDTLLAAGITLPIEGAQANYLANVMRLNPGDPVRLFDDLTGEWLATVTDRSKRSLTLTVTDHLCEREAVPDLWLLFAPLKKDRLHFLVEKATELGAARLQPVVTRRTIVDRPNPERLRAHMIEAAEQCDRTALPKLAPPEKLATLLAAWPGDRALLFADEAGGVPLRDAARPTPTAILIGPEGGFTDDERAAIRATPSAIAITLGPRILRAETAAAAALAVWMALAGDWR